MSEIISKEEAFSRGLPKWPQCIIEGPSIDEEDALEIIRRTDTFFEYSSGNDREFIEKVEKICRIPKYGDYTNKDGTCDYDQYHKDRDAFEEKWGLIYTEYIDNSWISTSFIGGPHGFCNPDGVIWFQNNVGKWPSVEEIYDDLITLGKAFPKLEMTCTLMDAEESEDANGVVSLLLKNGEITCMEPVRKNNKDIEPSPWRSIFDTKSEQYFSIEQIQKWADQVYKD